MTDVDVNAPAELAPTMAPPTRTDDQILPHIRWVPIGKSNCYLDVDRPQSNPIFKIAVDLLKHTNFFRTSGFERPRAPVLQILWGVINRAHIDYAERMWEEFTQSIHTFTKLIIHYLQSKHKFHARPGSPLHLPNEEPVLGYLKFSSKGTKREVFGMPIPNDLVTDDIRGKQYYNAYLEKVAKHKRYLAGEDVSDPDSPAPKPTKGAKPKTTKKPTLTQQTKPKTKPSIAKTTKSTPFQPPKPKPAPAKP
ncbi:hypothetical protein Tco_1082058 [Tanacetum coccineum]|uniref:Histone deacetylase 14 n=1 Tax=Tanacetum coccineum TaxID=301880 RepID=A0ABQ5HZD1_9ASTR